MAEELNIAAVLEGLKPYEDLNGIERILAAHTGTVQLLLSLLFGEEVVVVVLDQEERDGCAFRSVQLRTINTDILVCGAISIIDYQRCSGGVVVDVREGKLGLGQIAVKHEINTVRTITGLEVEPASIKRNYTMEGKGLYYEITEIFPRDLFRVARWAAAMKEAAG